MEASELFNEIQPFTGELPGLPSVAESPAVLAEVAAQREIAEVQSMMAIAKRFPRNQAKAMDRILVACQRPSLAERALYTYARGGTDITGPSIRLAEAIAQQWGNLAFGIRELEQRPGESTVEAYAWDLETNTRQNKVFQVRHIRYTRKGTYSLEDPRDVYETVANQGARRLRSCILGVIPGDVVEAAQEQCEATLKAKADVSPEAVAKMVQAFESFGVNKAMLEARIQRRLESITAAQIISLRKIYNSLRDGMSKPGDWFEEQEAKEAQPEKYPSHKPVEEKKERKPRSDRGTTRPKAGDSGKAEASPGQTTESPATGTIGPIEAGLMEAPTALDPEELQEIFNMAGHAGKTIQEVCDKYEVSSIDEMDRATGNECLGWLMDLVAEKQASPSSQ